MSIGALILIVIVLGFVYWLVGLSPLPQPFLKIVQVILIGLAILLVINFALSLVGYGFINLRR